MKLKQDAWDIANIWGDILMHSPETKLLHFEQDFTISWQKSLQN